MTTTYTKKVLSGSTNGRPIKVVGVTTSGLTTIHTTEAPTGTAGMETLDLTVTNTNTAGTTVQLTLFAGGTTVPDDQIVSGWAVPGDGFPYPLPRFILQNSLAAKAMASVANILLVSGEVNRVAVS